MPILLPIEGHQDIIFRANFRERAHRDLGMVANFVNPRVSIDLPLSATFRRNGHTDFRFSANFVKVHADLPFSVTFQNAASTASLPMSATFFSHSGTTDLSISAVFRSVTDFPFSATFRQATNRDFVFLATFKRKASLLMSAHFRAVNHADLSMKAFFGRFKKDFPMSAVFRRSATTDFQAAITIHPYVAPHGVIFNATNDFRAQIQVIRPSANDLHLSATFVRHDAKSFRARIKIRSRFFGHGGVHVHLHQVAPGTHAITTPQDVIVQTTQDGYFVFNGLPPGTYEITPVYQDMIFSPPLLITTISGRNDTLFFYSDGTFAGQTLGSVPLSVSNSECLITPNEGGAGTLAIDGYILPTDNTFFGSILVTAHSADDAAKFRQTLSRMLGRGV